MESYKMVEVFKIPNKIYFTGIINPYKIYMLLNYANKNILFEVTPEYLKKYSSNTFYFLGSDLNDDERKLLANYHNVIECDCIYNIRKESKLESEEKGFLKKFKYHNN